MAVFKCLTRGPQAARDHQQQYMEKWDKRKAALLPEHESFCDELIPDVAPSARKKFPFLLCEMLEDAGFGAPEVTTQMIAAGVPMFGPFPSTGVFPEKHRKATLNREVLLKSAKWARPALVNSQQYSADKEVEEELWRLTMEEVQKGECKGPYTEAELDAIFPAGWLAAKRFAVCQKLKVKSCNHIKL